MKHCLLLRVSFVLVVMATTVMCAQSAGDWGGALDEAFIRQAAVTRVMPEFPSTLVLRRSPRLIQIKIAIDDEGCVVSMRVPPNTDEVLKQSLADAVSQWTFKLPESRVPGKTLSHLTFKFLSEGAERSVELNDPEPTFKDSEHPGYWNGPKELFEWNNWEEVKARKVDQ